MSLLRALLQNVSLGILFIYSISMAIHQLWAANIPLNIKYYKMATVVDMSCHKQPLTYMQTAEVALTIFSSLS